MGLTVRRGVPVVSVLGIGIPHSFWIFPKHSSKALIHFPCLKAEISAWRQKSLFGKEGSELVPSDCSYCISVTVYVSLWAPLLLLITAISKLGVGGLEHSRTTCSFYNSLLLFEKHLPLLSQSCFPSLIQEFLLISSPPRISLLAFPVILWVCYFIF